MNRVLVGVGRNTKSVVEEVNLQWRLFYVPFQVFVSLMKHFRCSFSLNVSNQKQPSEGVTLMIC